MGTENSSDGLLLHERNVSLSLCSEQLEAKSTEVMHCISPDSTIPGPLPAQVPRRIQYQSYKRLLKDLEEQTELLASSSDFSKKLAWFCENSLS